MFTEVLNMPSVTDLRSMVTFLRLNLGKVTKAVPMPSPVLVQAQFLRIVPSRIVLYHVR